MRSFRPFLPIILASLVAQLLTGLLFGWVVFGYDTPTYLTAIDSLKAGQLDLLRTPGYPLLIWLSQSIGGANYPYTALLVLQHLLFFASLWFFWQLASHLLIKPRVVFIVTLLYACLPAVYSWNAMVYTESLTLSLTTMVLYLLLRVIERGGAVNVLLIGLLTFVLLALRPAALYLLPLLIGCFILVWLRGHAKVGMLGMLAVVSIIAALVYYAHTFKKQHGARQLTAVSTINQYVVLREIEFVKQDIPSDAFQERINQIINVHRYHWWDAFIEAHALLEEFGLAEMQRQVKARIETHKREFFIYQLVLFLRSTSSNVFRIHLGVVDMDPAHPTRSILQKSLAYITQWVRIDLLWVVCGVSTLLLLFGKLAGVQFWAMLLLLLNTLGNYAVVVLGAMAGTYDRLLSPSYGSFILLGAFVASVLAAGLGSARGESC